MQEERPAETPPPLFEEPLIEDWMRPGLDQLGRIEPRLAVQLEQEGDSFVRIAPSAEVSVDVFASSRGVLEPPPQVVFTFSWLKKGGAEWVGVSLVRAAQRQLGLDAVLVMVLDADVLEARHWLDEGTRLFVLPREGEALSYEQRLAFVRAYLSSARPASVINCNAWMMWELTRTDGAFLAASSRLYAMLFCFDYTKSGAPRGYGASHLAESLPHLSGVLLDNAEFIQTLKGLFGFPPEWLGKMKVMYQPVRRTPPRPRAVGRERPLILWAGRICRQKRPDLLVRIAELRPEYDFHVYGDFYVDYHDGAFAGAELFDRPNISYRGEYDLLDELPYEEAAAFLYTSLWDGIPNIVLAAGALEIPIVTARIGGLGEVISEDRGWPVGDHEDPAAYARALDQVISDPEAALAKTAALKLHLDSGHSAEAFEARVRELKLFARG